MAYTTTAAVKTYLGISGSGDDALLTTLITAAQGYIDSYCHQTFEAGSDTTRYFNAADVDASLQTLTLDYPLCQITSVTNGDDTLVTDYRTIPRNDAPYYALRVIGSGYWDADDDDAEIEIVGRWAYSVTAPDVVAQACVRLTAFLYRQKDTSADIDRALITDAGVTILPGSMPRDVAEMLAPFVRY